MEREAQTSEDMLLRTDPIQKQFYRPSEVCRLTGLGRSRVYRAISEGKWPSVRVGGAILIPKAELHAELGLTEGEVSV